MGYAAPIGPGRRVIAVLALLAIVLMIVVGGYLVSVRVSGTRETVEALDRLASRRRAEVRALRQDFEIRSRMSELDRWSERLDLDAPVADQFVRDRQAIPAAAGVRRHELTAAEVEEGRRALNAPKPAYPALARERMDALVDRIASP